jgi:tight adherence protein B
MSKEMVGAAIMATFVVAGLLLLAAMKSGHADELQRLAKHQKRLSDKAPVDGTENIFAQQRADYLSKVLAQAGLEAKYDTIKTQWIMTTIGSAITLMILAFFASPDLLILGLILGAPAGAAGFIMYLNRLAKQRQDKMTEQLPQVLESMVSALRAGSPIMETFKVLSETAPDPIRSEFKRALISLQLGKSFREALSEMSTRIRTPDFKLLTQAVYISQDVGANLADVVATIAEAIRERFKLRDFMNSLTAQGKATAGFIGVLPYGITALTYVMTPGYMIPFFNHPIARLVFIGLILWEFIGFWILMKITTFEV